MLTHKGTQTIKTPRLTLRRFTPDDAQAMFDNWESDPAVTEFLTWKPHADIDETRQILKSWLSNYENNDYYHWAIVPGGTDEPIGSLAVVDINDNISMVCIGYCLGKAWWHKGIMSEALAAVIEFFFTEVGINRIEARHDPNNPHSGGVMKKCGMKYEGTMRQADFSNKGIVDECIYAILREEWIMCHGN